MKRANFVRWVLAITLLLVLLVIPGCSKKEEPRNMAPSISKEDVKQQAKEAYNTTKAYTQEQMQAFLTETQTKFAQYEKDIDQLQAKAEKLEGQAKANAEQRLAELRQKRDAVSEKLKDLNSSKAGAWEQIKSGVDAAMEDLDKAYKKAVAEFN
ncbi:MAG: hypothetical protein M0036_02980 [Desulfobacteraceae bacterium]|nr:hypothetical protein [Desulfobacteraceae bacterium]